MNNKTVIIRQEEHKPISSPFCGDGFVISDAKHNKNFDIDFFNNIKPTSAHYHKNFDEVYTATKGTLIIDIYDPFEDIYITLTLNKNEVLIIPAGVHHKISDA